jgi:hypothetical protein
MNQASSSAASAGHPLPRERGLVLKNLADFQTELARVAAGFIPGMADWAVRNEMPRHVFSDFRLVQDLRARHRELGVAPGDLHLSRATPARGLIDLLAEAPGAADALEAIYGHAKVRLEAWLRDASAAARGIYDLPTLPLLEANIELLRKQAAWALAARPSLGEGSADFLRRVEAALVDLGTALEATERRRAEPWREARRVGRLPLSDGTTPRGFSSTATLPPMPGADAPYRERERFYAMNFLQEIQAADSCAALLFDAPDMPWEFYFDVARHMWDESRHAMFGLKKLNALNIPLGEVALSTTAYRLRQTIAPHDRYAALTTQEADAFPGKHQGLKEALEHNDEVGAMTWSYDIADETQHVRYGQKWLATLADAMGDPRSVEQVKNDAENWRATVLAVAYRPHSDEARAAAAAGGLNHP